jgi:hypothetical protein
MMVFDEHLDKWKVETIKALPSPLIALIQILVRCALLFGGDILQHDHLLSSPLPSLSYVHLRNRPHIFITRNQENSESTTLRPHPSSLSIPFIPPTPQPCRSPRITAHFFLPSHSLNIPSKLLPIKFVGKLLMISPIFSFTLSKSTPA